jgi:hypothetical protein
MSFLGNFLNVLHVIQEVDHVASPILQIVAQQTGNPTVGAIAAGVSLADQLLGPGTGAQKKQIATAVVNSVQPGIDQTALSASIDGIVGAINLLNAEMNKAASIQVAAP